MILIRMSLLLVLRMFMELFYKLKQNIKKRDVNYMENTNDTQYFKVVKEPERSVKDTLEIVYQALVEKGYNPIAQIVGYVMSGDPTYITSHQNARTLVMNVDRDELLKEMIVKQRIEHELISELAYSDELTQIGNRTAYIEQLQRLTEKKDKNQVGIIIMDINNLKHINDSMGHQVGDDLIRNGACVICESFGRVGRIYRIGGDEFAVLLVNENPQKIYEENLGIFYKKMKQKNETNDFPYIISIAHGVAYCGDITTKNLNETENTADLRMYENKIEMKKG